MFEESTPSTTASRMGGEFMPAWSARITRREFLLMSAAVAAGLGGFFLRLDKSGGTAHAQPAPSDEPSVFLPYIANERPYIKGLCYSPYRDGQNPDTGPYPSEEQIKADIRILDPIVEHIRTYGSDHGFNHIPGYIQELGSGIKVNAGCWLGSDEVVNASLINNLIAEVNTYSNVIAATVGNETQQFNTLPEARLIEHIQYVRQHIRSNVTVTTGDTWFAWSQHPNLVDVVDYILAHVYPYWEGVSLANVISYIDEKYELLRSLYPGKRMAIGEAGWPSAGPTNGAAVPGLENQRSFIDQFLAWTRSKCIDFYLFEAFDEAWKITYEGEVGGHWGIYYSNRTPKHPGLTIK
jgi:exo-beta-1,3-glucanase (GH17 family)